MYPKLVFLIFIWLFNNAVYGQDFNAYIELNIKLDSLRADENFEDARSLYDSLFENYEFLMAPGEYIVAAGINVMAGKNDRAYELLEKQVFNKFDRFLDYDALTTDMYLMPLFGDERWTVLLEQVEENNRIKTNKSNEKLKAELEQIYADYQADRSYIYPFSQAYGEDSKEVQLLKDSMVYRDSINQIRVSSFIDANGITGVDEVGRQGVMGMFLALNVSDTTCRIKYLPLVKDAFLKEKIKPRTYAMYLDILLLDRGLKQLYGTQVEEDGQGDYFQFKPIQDPGHLAERRAEIGLMPMKRYAKLIGLKWEL
jgi:hypothetical protein